MSRKTWVMLGMIAGTYTGGFIPTLFNQDIFSLWAITGSGIGGLLGIFIAYKLTA